jgi:gliding motility-associated-like protein
MHCGHCTLMKYFRTLCILFVFLFSVLNCSCMLAQQHSVHAKNGMNATPRNYTFFTSPYKDASSEATQRNQGYERHPELGMLFAETPCDNCYELIGKRTEVSKTFIKEGSAGKDMMQQTATSPMHYKDAEGNWRTIKTQLERDNSNGIFTALNQETAVTVSPGLKSASLGKDDQLLQFNHDLELVYALPDGTEQPIGAADYTHYTAGDDGVYITNAWTGIDIEMYVARGAIKTNFIINNSMPAYAAGKLLVRDHLGLNKGWSLVVPGEDKHHRAGNLEVRNNTDHVAYNISPATAYEKKAAANSLQLLEYGISGSVLDIIVPGNFLNRPAASYPVIIDPLISIAVSTPVSGSKYSAGWTAGCVYINPATVPAGITVTDVQFTFSYTTSGGARINNGADDFTLTTLLGTCRSPSAPGLWWSCNDTGVGTCNQIGVTIFPQIHPCISAAQCTAYNLDLAMKFYQNYANTSLSCSPDYISALGNFTVTVFGHVLEAGSITATNTTICAGQPTTLNATSLYGVAPVSYSWAPGGLTGSSVTVNPTTTTTYTVTLTDACGNFSASAYTINVNPVGPVSGIFTVCVGGTTALSNISGPGTWVSANPAKATVNAATGVVTGIATGSAVISYTSLTGCTASATVIIKPAILPISGSAVVCEGSSTTLSDASTGGIWSSTAPTVATISGTSTIGVATGVGAGNATISYTAFGGGCYTVANITVNALSPITGITALCLGATTTLSDAATGGTWSSTNPVIASVGATTGLVHSLAAGVDTIIYTLPTGCIASRAITVNPLSPIVGTIVICQGAVTTLTHAAPGGTWASGNPAIASINPTSGLVSGLSSGAAAITYTLPGGCSSTATMTINPSPAISGSTSVCMGGVTTLSSAVAGSWASSNTTIATVGAATGIVNGIAVGACSINFTATTGCSAVANMNVSLATPITGITSVCPGGSVTLSNITPGGTWASANTGIAIVSISSGAVTGVSGGVVAIAYTNPSGCTVSISMSVNTISPVTGFTEICTVSSATLTNAIPGGTWSSSNPAIVAIDVSTGLASGLTAGVAAINYTTPSGCIATTSFTVDAPLPITGVASLCQGGGSVLSNPVPGGVWLSGTPAVATIGIASGIANALVPGTTTINYTTPAGCNSYLSITVNAVAPVTGTAVLCAGNTTTLSNAISGGSWSSASPAVAAVGFTSGIATGVAAGTVTINYSTPAGCISSIVVTINASPTSIAGSTLLCTSTTLSNGMPGGSWLSSNTSIAVIGFFSGIATGLAPGTVTITYTLPGGCAASTGVTVDPLLPITGTANVCQGSTTTLSYPSPGGLWSSLNPTIATVAATTGVVTGVSSGVTTISYVTVTGCVSTIFVTVHSLLPVSGLTTLCQGGTTVLTDATPGGVWTTSNAAVAPVGSASGLVAGSLAGVATITYTTPAGCITAVTVTVNPLSPTTGVSALCVGSATTLNNATLGGGIWTSLLPSVATVHPATGLVSGVTPGTAIIRFTSSLGCIINFSETINPLPSAIIGALSVCMSSTTTLSNLLLGGTWVSYDPAVATVGAGSGVLAGVSVNTVAVSYTSAAGCVRSAVVTVNPLPMPITGLAAICEGASTNLFDATTGTWSSVSPAIATVTPSGIVTGLVAGITNIKFTTPAGCFVSRQVTVNALPAAISGTTILCEGANSTLTNTLAGGSWSSSNPASAAIGALSGMLSGVAAGNATITYITAAGCFAATGATVNTTPVISGFSFTNPTTCINADGTITLNGLHAGETYNVHYIFASSPVSLAATTSGVGSITLSGLAAGSYINLSVTTLLGCISNVVAGPVTLSLPPTPATPVAGNNTPICAGNIINLTATDATAGVTYSWSGPGGYTATQQNPSIGSATVAESGAYTVTATKLACISAPASTLVVVHPIPAISHLTSGNPSTCLGVDGVIVLNGLAPGVSYSIAYLLNGTGRSLTALADDSGKVSIAGLKAGRYSAIMMSSFTCLSNTVGPVTLSDPLPPSASVIWSNSPICAGKTLSITSTTEISNLTYDWEGPNGYVSNGQNLLMPDVTMADSGVYTLTIKYLNCPTTVTESIMVHPAVLLTNVTQDQVVPISGSVQLHASGALLYVWSPFDGTLSNPNIDSPIATPQVSTVYSVEGINTWGCRDTASVRLTIDYDITELMPTAFTPNNDGNNDIFRIVNVKYDKLVEFNIYNRWGQLVYHNPYRPAEGWDGTYHGVPQDIGTYFYNIIVTRPDGKTKTIKGEMVLMR